MKLLYLIPGLYNSGGMERVLTLKVNYLSDQMNYDITIATTDQKNRPAFFKLSSKINHIDLDINFEDELNSPLPIRYYHYYKKTKLYKKKILNLLQKEHFDVVISTCGKELEFLPLKDSSSQIAEFHFSKFYNKELFENKYPGLLGKLLGNILSYNLIRNAKRLDKLVVLTQKDKESWLLDNNNISQIYNPVSYVSNLKSECSYKRCIAVGRLSSQKGFDFLIDAWNLISQKHPDWVLDVYGDGELMDSLQKQIDNLKLKTIHLKGKTNDIGKEYLASSIYLMTSRFEGFPMVLLEASEYGLPLVSFDCDFGPSELIEDGVNGYLIYNRDIKLFAEKVCYLIENDECRKEMGYNSAVLVKKYHIDVIMQQWDLLFHQLVKKTN